MARANLPTFDLLPHYYYVVAKIDETPLGQLQNFSPSSQINSTEVGRIGTSTQKTLRQSKTSTLSISFYPDEDLSEASYYFGETDAPAVGEKITLSTDGDPKDFLILVYDSEDGSATEIQRHHITQFVPLQLGLSLQANGEPAMTVSGNIEVWDVERKA